MQAGIFLSSHGFLSLHSLSILSLLIQFLGLGLSFLLCSLLLRHALWDDRAWVRLVGGERIYALRVSLVCRVWQYVEIRLASLLRATIRS
jgi:hypothetical protein